MTLTFGYRKDSTNGFRLHGLAVPVLSMTAVLLYSSLLGGLVNYSASQDMTVHAQELTGADIQEAAYALPAESMKSAATILDERFPRSYINDDADLLLNGKILSASVGTAAKRSMVYMMDQNEEFTLVLLEDGTVGYVRNGSLTDDLAYIFDDADGLRWADEGCAVLSAPAADAEVLVYPEYNDEIQLVGTNDMTYWKVRFNDTYGYVDRNSLMDEMYVEPEPEPEPVVEQAAPVSAPKANPAWDGQVLNKWIGVVYGPSGKETYYNLNMSGVIALCQAAGIYGEYWVRDDGVKMYGDYVMAACGFTVRPRGTIVETSLGTAICADTGTFSYEDPYQVDIAVNW